MKFVQSTRVMLALTAISPAFAATACGGPASPVVIVVDTPVTVATTWNGRYDIRTSIDINAPLEIAPCSVITIAPGAVISVRNGGSIRALGTAACPIRIQSAKPAPAAGDWERIDIYSTASSNSLFQHTEILHGNASIYGVVWVEDRASVGLDNVRIAQCTGTGVQLAGTARLSTFSNVSFEAIGPEVMKVGPVALASMGRLSATGIPNARVVLDGTTSAAAATWRSLGVPLEVPSMAIESGVIEIEAGSIVRFAPDAVISVRNGGALRALGTAASPIVFESAKPAQAAGDWRRIEFYQTSSSTNLLRNTTVRHGGDALYGVLWVEMGATLALESVTMNMNSSCDVGGEGTVNNTGSTITRCAM